MTDTSLSEQIHKYDDIRERVELRLVKGFEDKGIMEQIPCVEFNGMGMILVFYVGVGMVNGVEMGFYITNEHLELWDMTAMDLFEDMVKM